MTAVAASFAGLDGADSDRPAIDSRRKTIALLGASGGIGQALLERLVQRDDVVRIHATRFRSQVDAAQLNRLSEGSGVEVQWTDLDATDEAAVSAWMGTVGRLDWLINCIGFLHDGSSTPEKSVRSFDPVHFQRSMSVNCLPTLLLGKYALPHLGNKGQAVFATISAKVGSIEDNRLGGWYSYRASKAALNMALKCLSIEWARSAPGIRVVALHPGTTDTSLSQPFQRNVPADQLFTPDKTARLLIAQIERLQEQPTGQFIAYDGAEIPW